MHSPKIIIPIQPKTLAEVKKLLAAAEKEGDMTEIWLDKITKLDAEKVRQVVKLAKKPIILNLKDSAEKGSFKGTAEERLTLLLAGAKAGAQYVDLPLEFPLKLIQKFKKATKRSKLILSWHDFTETPDLGYLKELVVKAKRKGAGIIKLVSMANTWEDLRPIFALAWQLAAKKETFIIMAMGAKGEPSRIITPLIGGFGMFAALNEKSATAPGQITAGELKKWWSVFS